jgi:phosphatidylserine/phosphatidylglycerophosphate/cardiolipin synthase-like enzyme
MANAGLELDAGFCPARVLGSASNSRSKRRTLETAHTARDGISRLVKGIKKAKRSVEIVIFRFDRDELERAMVEAVQDGIFVHALIAFTNRGGEEHLRKLEMELLDKGVSVARTAGDLVRYHGKMMLVDRKELYLLLSTSRTSTWITAGVLNHHAQPKPAGGRQTFDADTRQNYSAGYRNFWSSCKCARN